jgi:hypothetical protein
MANFKAMVQ